MPKLSSYPLAFFAALALASALLVHTAEAQILVSSGSPYTQNFDSLGTVSNGWTDNATLLGWYASKTAGGATVTGYRAGSGTDNAGALYSFGVAGVKSVDDRALGSVASGTPGNFAYGVRFQNDTSLAITNVTITYTGEQWRQAGNINTQTLAFSYFISSAPITTSDAAGVDSWVPVHGLDFNTPTVGTNSTTSWALDGNAATNRQVFTGVLLTNVVVFPGQEIFFRWFDLNDSGNDHGLAVDDLTISFTSINAVVVAPDIPPAGQPQSRTNNAGTRATFTVSATGSAPSYQWRKDGVDIPNGVKFSGVTSPSLSIANLVANDAGSYTVYVANSAGNVTSADAVLTVIDPAVNTQPASRTNIAGDTANFFAGAAGTIPLSYQWQFNGTDIIDATANSLNVLSVQSTNQGGYSVVVGNVLGSTATSSVATLTLLATPATNIARWDFNATNTLIVTAPVTSSGNGAASLVNGVTASFASGTFSDPAGAPGGANSGWNTTGYPPQGTSNRTAGVQFNMSTVGYQDVLLTWEQRHSDTASKYVRLQYTTDGSAFVDGDVITMTSTNNGWVFYTSNLAGVPGVNNNPNFGFRFVSEWEATAMGNSNSNYVGTVSTYSTGGTIRFDVVTVFGNAFSGAIPLSIRADGGNVILTWSDPSFALQSAPAVTGTFTNVPGANSPYSTLISGSKQFFRLKR